MRQQKPSPPPPPPRQPQPPQSSSLSQYQQDIEKRPLFKDKNNSMEHKKVLRVLVIGDSHTGKTTFLRQRCHLAEGVLHADEKIRATEGCDMHILEHVPEMAKLVHQASDVKGRDLPRLPAGHRQSYVFQFFDLSGAKSARPFLHVYTRDNLDKFRAILFFFDLTNLKTLENFHQWLHAIYYSQSAQTSYGYVWRTPFLLIGTKEDLIDKDHLPRVEQNVRRLLRNVFQCTLRENVIYVSTKRENTLYSMMFDRFLTQLTLEYELLARAACDVHNGGGQYTTYSSNSMTSEQRAIIKRSENATQSPSATTNAQNAALLLSVGGGGGGDALPHAPGASEFARHDDVIGGLQKRTSKYYLQQNYYNKLQIQDHQTLWHDLKAVVTAKKDCAREYVARVYERVTGRASQSKLPVTEKQQQQLSGTQANKSLV